MNIPGLTQNEIESILKYVNKFPQIESVRVFGSRAMGNHKAGSDVDICLFGPSITQNIVAQLKALLEEESPLPYFFDIVDYKSITKPQFKEHIDTQSLKLK